MFAPTMRLNRGIGLLVAVVGVVALLAAWPQFLSAQPATSSATFLKFFATAPADNLHTVPNGKTFILTDVVCRRTSSEAPRCSAT